MKYLSLLIFLQVNVLSAQDFDKYQSMKSSGQIPAHFIESNYSKYIKDINQIESKDNRKTKNDKKDFYLANNYEISQLLLGGAVLFNNELTDYVNKVADVVLANDDRLRDQLHFYVIRSSAVNAFTTNDGYIFVNIGLLAQLENEAQLAFVLCHEIVHYMEDHAIDGFLEKNKMERGDKGYKRVSYEEKLVAECNFSQDMEFEADRKGLDLYLDTKYTSSELLGVFDVLQYCYLPFDEIKFDKDFLENKTFKFPDTLFSVEANPISFDDNYDDSKSTHPNTRRRREIAYREIEGENDKGKTAFIVSEKEFNKVRDISRFELTPLYLREKQYAMALYNTFLLSKTYPNSEYNKVATAQALYGLTIYKNERSFYDVCPKPKKTEGESHPLFYFLVELEKVELNVISAAYAWDVHKQFPTNKTAKLLSDDLLKELAFEHDLSPYDFYKKPKGEVKKEIVQKEETPDKNESKYDKIRRSQKKVDVEEEDSFYKYAFIEHLKDRKFKSTFFDFVDLKEKERQEENDDSGEKRKARQKEEKMIRKKGKALGIDKLVIVNPFYLIYDGDKDKVEYIKSESEETVLSKKLMKMSKKLKLSTEIIEPNELNQNDIERYLQIATLNAWVSENFNHEDVDCISSSQQSMDKVIEHFGTKYFAWVGVFELEGSSKANGYYFIIFDAESGDLILSVEEYRRSKLKSDQLNALIFNGLYQAHNKRKKKR
ncbi:MAG: M48 family metallopeptidase [Flavobacteriales bacterium]|nr:M48 family metallopeptidase [Flavobacteriales bacterium]